MKILYVSPMDQSGYAQAARLYLGSLVAAGYDVVFRRLDLGGTPVDSPLVRELEARPLEGVTHVVQHTLPVHYEYDSRFVNVGLFAWETDSIPSRWVRRLNMMDGVVCFNRAQALTATRSGVAAPLAVVPHACEPPPAEPPPPLPLVESFRRQGEFVFYAVGEWTRRKNWQALLRAFHMAFRGSDQARLVIKTGMPGVPPTEVKARVEKFCDDIHAGMRLGPVRRKEVILAEPFAQEEMLSLHAAGDCYVSTSYGEAWNLGGAQAMAMGRPVIAPDAQGFRDYVAHGETGCLVGGRWEPCFGGVDAPPGIYSARERWFSVDVEEFAHSLRTLYDHPQEAKRMGEEAARSASRFDFPTVGRLLGDFIARGRHPPAPQRGRPG